MILTKTFDNHSSDIIGDNHIATSMRTPLRKNAFQVSDTTKKATIAYLFSEIMEVLGLDLTDDSLKGTPERVAKLGISNYRPGTAALSSIISPTANIKKLGINN